MQVSEGGVAIDVEVWRMPVEHFGSFVAGIPAPLGIGKVKLEDGSMVSGFLCESLGVADAADISALGGWRQIFEDARLKRRCKPRHSDVGISTCFVPDGQ